MVNFLSTKFMANDDFFEPPRRADSQNPIFLFCLILGPDHLRGPGVSLGRMLGGPSIEPFFGGGGGLARGAVSTPAPPPPPTGLKARPPLSEHHIPVVQVGQARTLTALRTHLQSCLAVVPLYALNAF